MSGHEKLYWVESVKKFVKKAIYGIFIVRIFLRNGLGREPVNPAGEVEFQRNIDQFIIWITRLHKQRS